VALIRRTPRSTSTRRAGIVVAATGLVLAASGLGAGVAGAAPKDGDLQITICHATSSVTNPYRTLTVSVNAADGGLGQGGNDHSSHTGPVFDFTADPSDPDYPYHPPAKDWGDIIPPFAWDGGSFPGLNWDEAGQAIHAADCGDPSAPAEEIPDEETPDEETPGEETPGEETPGEETPGEETPGEETPGEETPGEETPGDDTPDEEPEGEEPEGQQPQGEEPQEEEPEPVDACPDVEGVQADPAECEVGLAPPVVVENEEPPAVAAGQARRPTQVAGIQVLPRTAPVVAGQQLPRTGTDVTALALAGLGLVLVGAGAVITARRPAEAALR